MAFFEYYDGATTEGACTVSADMSLSESNIPYLLVRVDGSPAQASFSVTPSDGSFLNIVYINSNGDETNLYEQQNNFDRDSFTVGASLPAGYGRIEFRGDTKIHLELRINPAQDGSVQIVHQ